jgi:hypothetical protein
MDRDGHVSFAPDPTRNSTLPPWKCRDAVATMAQVMGHFGSQFVADITGHERGFGAPALAILSNPTLSAKNQLTVHSRQSKSQTRRRRWFPRKARPELAERPESSFFRADLGPSIREADESDSHSFG